MIIVCGNRVHHLTRAGITSRGRGRNRVSCKLGRGQFVAEASLFYVWNELKGCGERRRRRPHEPPPPHWPSTRYGRQPP